MKTKKILEDLPGHADEVGKLSLVSKGAWPLPPVIHSVECRSLMRKSGFHGIHCGKYHNIAALNCLMDSALILIWEYYGIFRSGLIQQTNQNRLFSLCQARENTWISFTVEPRYNEGSRDWQFLFAIRRFRHIEVLFPIFYHCWDKENRLLCRGRRYVEVRFIDIPLYFWLMKKITGLNFKPITAKSGLLQQPNRRKLIRFNTVKSWRIMELWFFNFECDK